MKLLKSSIGIAAVLAISLLAFRAQDTGSIKGTVTPPEAGLKAWAVSATDTLQSAIQDGAFEIRGAAAGTYRLIIEANPPYKNVAKEDVVVQAGSATDVGAIPLSQ